MGRTVVADEGLQEKLTAIAKANTFQLGLLIGQSTSDQDIIIHLAPSPVPDEGDLSSEEEESPPEPRPDHSRSKWPDAIPKVVDANVAQHARQVVRMLPGGLDIIGLYVVTPQADFTSSQSQSKLRSVAAAVHRTASRILLETTEVSTEKTILHVCSQTFKTVCRTVDVSPVATTPQAAADFKFLRGGTRWQQLTYNYSINLSLWIPKEKLPQSLYKTVQALLKPWVTSVMDSLILFDSRLRNSDDLLDPHADDKPAKKKGGGKGQMDLTPPKIFGVEILDSGTPLPAPGAPTKTSGSVRLCGTLAGLAFVHAKASVGEAKAAVLVDLVRSVMARWEMHCDSLVEEPPSHMGPIIHEPPRRVFLEGGGLPVSLCDYLFPGDTCGDACQSAKELLSLRVHKEHVDDTLETLADASDVMEGDQSCSGEVEEIGGHGGGGERGCPVTSILLAVAVAVVGVGVSYVTLQGSKALT